MKTINVIAICVLIVFCIGLLFAFNGPGKNLSAPQEQKLAGKEKHKVDLVSAKKLIKNHRNSSKSPMFKGGFFAREAFEKILAQPKVIGVRYYYAQTDEGNPTIVLVGVDDAGMDLQTGFIAELAVPCPPLCDDASELAK
jgi:hypothetical protein